MFSTGKPLHKIFYVIGLVAIFLAVYSQYFIDYTQVTGFLVVYGVPVLVVSLLFGKPLLKKAAKNNRTATKYGLGLFGTFTVLGLFLSFVALAIILIFEPQASNLLQRPNPVLEVPPNVAWIMIAVSFLIVGPAEEYLFRGFMYGGLLSIFKGKHWFPLAIGSSFLFASVHGYYAITYGVASAVPFISLITFSIAMSVTYYWSDGNILVPAIIHGAYDATGFLGVATTTEVGLAGRLIMILIGVVFAAIYLPKKISRLKFLSPPPPPPPAPPETPQSPPETPPPEAPPQQMRFFRNR